MEQTRLIYSADPANENRPHYIDLFRGLCLQNMKNMTQFKKGSPLLIAGTIRLAVDGENVEAISPVWPVKNAFNKADDAWKRTLRSAGLRPKQLNTYGKELRVAWNEDHSKTYCASSPGAYVDAIPDGVESEYASGQYNAAGEEIHVWAQISDPAYWGSLAGQYNSQAFDNTRAAVPLSGSVDVQDKKFIVFGTQSGATATYLPILNTYLDSRINETRVEDTDMDEIPTADNDFIMMLAPGEEVADDVIDNVTDEGRWRPYTTDSALKTTNVVTAGANVAGQETTFVAPLGLLKWIPSSALTSKLVIDIVAIGEM